MSCDLLASNELLQVVVRDLAVGRDLQVGRLDVVLSVGPELTAARALRQEPSRRADLGVLELISASALRARLLLADLRPRLPQPHSGERAVTLPAAHQHAVGLRVL